MCVLPFCFGQSIQSWQSAVRGDGHFCQWGYSRILCCFILSTTASHDAQVQMFICPTPCCMVRVRLTRLSHVCRDAPGGRRSFMISMIAFGWVMLCVASFGPTPSTFLSMVICTCRILSLVERVNRISCERVVFREVGRSLSGCVSHVHFVCRAHTVDLHSRRLRLR